jgi:multiple sugar transport system substrate-binding protein
MMLLALILSVVQAGAVGNAWPLAIAGTPPAPTPVRVLMPAVFADAVAEPVHRFNRSHPLLQVEVVRGPLDTEAISDLATGSLLLGDTPYDLLMLDVTWTAKYAAAGWLEPLEPWLGDDALEGMVSGAELGNRFAGHLWRMPFSADTALLYWRTDLMERPPRTAAELVRIARSLQRQGKVRWGYVWQGRQYEGLSCVMLEVLHGFGARWWQPAQGTAEGRGGGETLLDSPAALRAAAWLSMLLRTGISPAAVANFAENESLQVFAAGEAAFLRNWPYAWGEIEKSGGPVAGRVGVTTMVSGDAPSGDEPSGEAPTGAGLGGGASLGSWGFGLLAGSVHPAEAAAVIRWLTGPELQRQLVLTQGYAPTWRSLYDDPDLQRRAPLLAVQRRSIEAGPLVRPLTPLYAQISDVLQRQISTMLTGEATAAAAMAAAQRQSELIVQAAAGTAGAGASS